MKINFKNGRTKDRHWLFKIATFGLVSCFGIYGMRLLSKPGAIMHPLEPQFSLQGAFHGKSALSVFSNGAFEETYKAYFFIGGWQLVVQSVDILIATTRTKTMKTIEYLRTEWITPEGISIQPVYYKLPSSSAAATPSPPCRKTEVRIWPEAGGAPPPLGTKQSTL